MNGFGQMLKDYLEFNKISQTDFASRLGITQKHMNNIINGKANISYELIIAISLLTDIDANLILYVENKKNVNKYLYENYKDEKGIKEFLNNNYYINELEKRSWIKFKDTMSLTQKAMDLLQYLNISSFDKVDNYLDTRISYKKNDKAND